MQNLHTDIHGDGKTPIIFHVDIIIDDNKEEADNYRTNALTSE